jgi:hypothetical protein
MDHLSFFVTRGTLVWQVAVAAAAVVGLVTAWVFVHRGMRSRAARARAALGKPSPEARVQDAGKRVTLAGTLAIVEEPGGGAARDAGGAAVSVLPQGLEHTEEPTPKARSATAGGVRLAVDVAGTPVLLDGMVQVLAGSRETEHCVGKAQGRVLLWDFAGALGALPSRAFAIRRLGPGDRVLVRGFLRHEPGPIDPGNYREAHAAFVLEVDPDDPDAPVIPMAYDGAPRPLVRSYKRTALRALAVPCGIVAVLAAVGEIGVRSGSDAGVTAAAATPFRRADALAMLRRELTLRTGADAKKVERAIALDRVRGRCDDAADDAFEHHRFDLSAKLALECKDAPREARAYLAMADFEQAAAAFERARLADPHMAPTLSEATAYVVTGKNGAAVTTLRALGRATEEGPKVRERFDCAALAIEARAGASAAQASLEELANQGSAPCWLLRADLFPPKERPTWFRYGYWTTEQRPMSVRATLAALALENTEREPDMNGDDASEAIHGTAPLFDPRLGIYAIPPAVAVSAAEGLAERKDAYSLERRAALLAELAAFDAYMGDLDEARAKAEASHAAVTDAHQLYGIQADEARRQYSRVIDVGARYSAEYTMSRADHASWRTSWATEQAAKLRASIDALAGRKVERSVTADAEILAAAAARASGDAAALTVLSSRDAREANRKLWQLALDQDSAGLVQRLEERGIDGRGVVDFLGKRSGLALDLSRWVRWNYPTACTTCGLYPLANQVVSRRDAAAAAGAADVVGETTEISRRLRAIFLRRDVAMLLAVLSDVSPP